MPGGYVTPFTNPCAQLAGNSKCKDYDDKDGRKLKVPASVNTASIVTDAAATDLLGARNVVGGCSPVGAGSIDDPNYNCGEWPPFFANADGTNVRRPANVYRSQGTIDLGGDCRGYGRQQAQFLRIFHGCYGFYFSSGAVCGGGSVPSSKYLQMQIDLTVALGMTNTIVTKRDSDGVILGTDTVAFSGGIAVSQNTQVDPNSGFRTASYSRSDTTQLDENGSITAPYNYFPIDRGTAIFGDVKDHYHLWGYGCDTGVLTFSVGGPGTPYSGTPTAITTEINTEASAATFATCTVNICSIVDDTIELKVTATGIGDFTTVTTPGQTNYCNGSGSNVYHLKIKLSSAHGYGDVLADITTNLEPLWDYVDRAKHPIRKDNLTASAAIYTRREVGSPVSPIFFPDDVDDKLHWTGSGYAQIPWIDENCYWYAFVYGTGAGSSAVSRNQIYDGAIIDPMFPAGTGYGVVAGGDTTAQAGSFDFLNHAYQNISGTCVKLGAGLTTVTAMDSSSGFESVPQNCFHFTESLLASVIWPCEFVFYGPLNGDDCVMVQRWREVQIRVPSENPCRPFGADKVTLDYSAADHCSGDTPVKADGSPLSLRWPNCPGLVFSDTPGVGGRVKVTAFAGGTVTLSLAQPYFSTPSAETVNVYDASMTLLGTAVATRIDDTHFSGFGSYPTATWITPVHRNDGTTAWHYYECDDFPKGHWVAENYSVSLDTGLLSQVAALQCAVDLNCGPVFLQAHANAPGGYNQVSLAVVRQWDTSTFYGTKICVGGILQSQGVNLTTCAMPDFVEATSLTPNGAPPQGDITQCGSVISLKTPWSIYYHCNSNFPL